ncbi:M42 family metallopeptidase [Vagococcus fluvialis]|uniref:M42 family metallopeptidase n=1 Tax=Vagococcus fluvialis TaxID=2738 RepID=UPI003D146B61
MEPYGKVNLTLLKELSEVHAIGGYERFVSRIVKKHVENFVDDISYDNSGSMICLKKGKKDGPNIMLSAHMDEVGFMVRHIDENGFVYLLPIGGWWGLVMPAQEMVVTTISEQEYIGVVGCRAPHGMPEKEKSKVIEPMDLYLDLGVSSKEEVLSLGIEIGDMVTPNTKFRVMNNPDYLLGKAWDDRICVAVCTEIIQNLKEINHDANIYFVASNQEEVGIRGARTATHVIKPDLAIALDVTTSQDTPLDSGSMALGNGVVLSFLDSLTMAHRGVYKEMKFLSDQLNLDINYDFMTEGGTDACNIHKAMTGIPTMTLSLPTRYMHSSRLLIHRKDYYQTVQLLTEFCSTMTQEKLLSIKNEIK